MPERLRAPPPACVVAATLSLQPSRLPAPPAPRPRPLLCPFGKRCIPHPLLCTTLPAHTSTPRRAPRRHSRGIGCRRARPHPPPLQTNRESCPCHARIPRCGEVRLSHSLSRHVARSACDDALTARWPAPVQPNAQVHRAGAAALDEAQTYVRAGSGATASWAALPPGPRPPATPPPAIVPANLAPACSSAAPARPQPPLAPAPSPCPTRPPCPTQPLRRPALPHGLHPRPAPPAPCIRLASPPRGSRPQPLSSPAALRVAVERLRRTPVAEPRSAPPPADRRSPLPMPPNEQVHRAGATALGEPTNLRCAGSGATASSAPRSAPTTVLTPRSRAPGTRQPSTHTTA